MLKAPKGLIKALKTPPVHIGNVVPRGALNLTSDSRGMKPDDEKRYKRVINA